MVLGSRFLILLELAWKGRYEVIFSLFPKFINNHKAFHVF